MGLTAELGRFVASLQADAWPETASATVRRGIADCVGVAFAGAREPVVARVMALVQPAPGGEARLWIDGRVAPAADAAFANAVAAHALDFDDTGLDGHPSVVLGPVVVAEAERLGRSWADAVTAYVAGYETWAELLRRDQDKHHGKGWHPTAVFGTVGCAAAAARLRGLSPMQAAHALGIAASMSAGLVANFGSMTKPLQVGLAARNGIVAAGLAEGGVDASSDALESPRGFLAALSPAGRVDLAAPCAAGSPWQIARQGLNIKRYPACYATHRIIDAALSLQPGLAGRIEEIDLVTVTIGRLQAAMLRSSRPDTPLDAKFSAEYTVACALARGHVDLQDFTEEQVTEPQVQGLLRKVVVLTTHEQDAEEPLFSPADRLTVRFRDGRALEAEPVRRALGHASRPIDDASLRAKFLRCATLALDGPTAQRWWEAAMAPAAAPVRWPSGQDAR